MLTQLCPKILHLSHIGVDYALEDSLFEQLQLLLVNSMPHKVILVHIQQFERLTHVVTFLHIDVAVHLESLGLGDHVIPIVEAIVSDIVAESSHQKREHIQIVELGIPRQALRPHNVVTVLGHVRPMQVVVVLHSTMVPVVYLNYELQELVLVYEVCQSIQIDEGTRDHRHPHVTAHSS